MKIIIVGAGISGLATYLFLKKYLLDLQPNDHHSIKIYESYDIHNLPTATWDPTKLPQTRQEPAFTTAPLGAGIGIGQNGISVLGRLGKDGEVLKRMEARGHPVKVWRLSTARGWKIVDANASDIGDGSVSRVLMIARQAAWEVLRDEVVRSNPDSLVIKRVHEVIIPETRDCRSIVKFADGTWDEADLLVGADGLRSAVRQAMFEKTEDREPQNWLQWARGQKPKLRDYVTPEFQGMAGLGGFMPSSVLRDKELEPGTMCLTLGPGGSFGHGYLTTAEGVVSRDQPEPGPIAAWWSSFPTSTPTPFQTGDAKVDQAAALSDLLKRHRSWYDPAIQDTLDFVEKSGIGHVFPTYTPPELHDWQVMGKAVLVGDAAHTINPSTGQGACQGLEDTETLARCLAHYLSRDDAATNERRAVSQALEKYVQIRKPRLHVLYEQSRKTAQTAVPDLGLPIEVLIFTTLWFMVKFQTWKSLNTYLLGYDVPAEVEKAIAEGE
jgi:2-polyprenyl-6-methoxyphenol hydroxylase-like FAD-dependent oxidoreductase